MDGKLMVTLEGPMGLIPGDPKHYLGLEIATLGAGPEGVRLKGEPL